MTTPDRTKRDPDVARRLALYTSHPDFADERGEEPRRRPVYRPSYDPGTGEIVLPECANVFEERDHWRARAEFATTQRGKERDLAERQAALIDTYAAELATANDTIATLEDAVREADRARVGWSTGALLLWMLLAFCAGMVFSGIAA